MAGWQELAGKKVYIVLKTGKQYQGKVTEIDDAGNGLIFIHILDKFSKVVIFSTGELASIKEEGF